MRIGLQGDRGKQQLEMWVPLDTPRKGLESDAGGDGAELVGDKSG